MATTTATIQQALRDLTEQRAEVAQQLALLEADLRVLDSAIDALSAVTGTAKASSPKVQRLTTTRQRAQGVKSTIVEILRESRGQVLHADQILNAVRARGIQLSAVDPKATIVTALLRLADERKAGNLSEGVWKLPLNRWVWSDRDPAWTVPPSPAAATQQLSAS